MPNSGPPQRVDCVLHRAIAWVMTVALLLSPFIAKIFLLLARSYRRMQVGFVPDLDLAGYPEGLEIKGSQHLPARR